MGLVLVPFFFAAFIIFIRAVFQFLPILKGTELPVQGILLGIFIPVILITIYTFLWIKEARVYMFTPHFRFMVALFYVPFVLSLLTKYLFKFANSPLVQTTLISWVVFSGLIIIPLFWYYFDFLKGKGVKLFY